MRKLGNQWKIPVAIVNGVVVFALAVAAASLIGPPSVRAAKPTRDSAEIKRVSAIADPLMRVVGHCRIGDGYDSVKAHFGGASLIKIVHNPHPEQFNVHVKWEDHRHTLLAIFYKRKLVFVDEELQVQRDKREAPIKKIETLNPTNGNTPCMMIVERRKDLYGGEAWDQATDCHLSSQEE